MSALSLLSFAGVSNAEVPDIPSAESVVHRSKPIQEERDQLLRVLSTIRADLKLCDKKGNLNRAETRDNYGNSTITLKCVDDEGADEPIQLRSVTEMWLIDSEECDHDANMYVTNTGGTYYNESTGWGYKVELSYKKIVCPASENVPEKTISETFTWDMDGEHLSTEMKKGGDFRGYIGNDGAGELKYQGLYKTIHIPTGRTKPVYEETQKVNTENERDMILEQGTKAVKLGEKMKK